LLPPVNLVGWSRRRQVVVCGVVAACRPSPQHHLCCNCMRALVAPDRHTHTIHQTHTHTHTHTQRHAPPAAHTCSLSLPGSIAPAWRRPAQPPHLVGGVVTTVTML
jgi:hypothetical protein